MRNAIPHGPDNLVCPFHRKAMSRVCHTCPMWVNLRGKNPNTGEDVDDWNCSFALMPIISLEGAQQSRQAGASADKVATEVSKFHEGMRQQNAQLAMIMQKSNGSADSRLIEVFDGGLDHRRDDLD